MRYHIIRKWCYSACFAAVLLCILLSPHYLLAQQKVITGKVTTASGEPSSNVTVAHKSKPGVATITDDAGKYTIRASVGDVLVFSSVGFAPVEMTVGSAATIDVSITAVQRSMDEVVVVGYGTMSKKDITTSIAKISPRNIPQAANSSVAGLVFGRAPGVQAVQQSAEPGGNINISIRGRGNPLIIVDGVQMPYSGLEPGNGGVAGELNGVQRGGFAGINPDDIESIEFLKDASASIYGVNASNGVMLITTKKGRSGRPAVSYDGSRSLVKNRKYLEPLTASEYMMYYNQLTKDKYLYDNKMAPYGTNTPGTFTPKYTESDIQKAGEGTDWLGLVLRDGAIDNHNVSVSGGTDKIVYYASGGYFNQVGTMEKSGMKRYAGRINLTMNFTKWLSVTAIVSGSKAYYSNSTAGWQTGNSGTQGFGALQAAVAYPRSVPVYDASGKYSLFQVTGNPVSLLDIQDQTTFKGLNTTLSADFKIFRNDLKARILFGNNDEDSKRDFFIPSTTFYFQLYRSRGSINLASRQNRTMEAVVMYNKRFLNNKLKLDAVAGVGQYQTDASGFGAQSADMLDGIGTDNLFAGVGAVGVSSYRTYDKKRSYWGRASLDMFDRYIVQLTARNDGFSQFFPDKKYAFFPSVSVAWKISNEGFMQNLKFINMLKLRASIGITGEASGYAYAAYSPDNSLISFNNGSSQIIPYTLSQLDYPNLQWPKTVNRNAGIDFSLANDRISGSFDWFQDDITRLLATTTTASLSFLGAQPINGAHRIRTGWEFNVNTTNIKARNFQWSSILNVSRTVFRHKERFEFEALPQGAKVDDPVNSIYVFRTNGILQAGEALSAVQMLLPERGRLPGNPRIVDVNGDKLLNASDIVRYNAFPAVSIGFGNNFSYKKFDLSVFFYGQLGGWGYNNLRAWATPAGFIAGTQSGIKEIKNVWSTTNPGGTLPGVAFDQLALGLPAGLDVDLEKTDFLRCRNVTLGYNFEQPAFKKVFRSFKLYVDVQNPFIITSYKIADPEVQAAAVKGGPAPYPMATTYSLGIKANL